MKISKKTILSVLIFGFVSIVSPALALVPGDLNADNSVNIFDIQLSANVAAGTQTSPDIVSRADVNGDGQRNIFDIQLTANIAAGKPTVGITSPANNTTYTTAQTINITAEAWDDSGSISKVEFYDGATKKGEDTSGPYSYSWSFTNADKGVHNFTAKAFDPQGNNAVSVQIILTVNIEPIVGAIRWDAWTGASNGVGAAVEKTLSPNKYHYRVPFYGVENSVDSISAACITQECMDAEIAYAKAMCLDYWAFIWYPSSSGLDQSRNLYFTSNHKDDINFVLIVEDERFIDEVSITEIVDFMKKPQYQKVMGNRPLLYFFGYQNLTASGISILRSQAQAEGLGNPYIVLMRGGGDEAVFATLGLDAMSLYAVGWIGDGAPYIDLANAETGQWNWMKSQGYKYLPHITAGWDPRPRVDNPLPWDPNPIYTANSWVQMPTPAQLASHVQQGINWTKTNNKTNESAAVIIYAWNEFDEGGYICPNLSNYGGTERLQALDEVLCSK